MKHLQENQKGQSLVELLVAFGLSAILLPALLTGMVASREGKAQEGQRIQAATLIKEADEAVRSIRESGWANISNGTFHPVVSGSSWSLQTGSEVVSGFTRQTIVSDGQRNNGQIVDSGGTVDPSTKKVQNVVSWTTPTVSSVSSVNYLTRYLNNNSWIQTTQAQFDTGTKVNTVSTNTSDGEVVLGPGIANSDYGNKFLLTANSTIGAMTTSSMKTSLRFSAQSTKTVNAIRVYLQEEVGTSPTYRFGLQADSAGLPSGTYLGSGTLVATTTGWQTITLAPAVAITAGTTYHLVVSYQSGTISTSRYISLRRTTPQNNLYPYNNNSDLQQNTLFNSGSSWTIQNFQPLYELDFSDASFEGNAYESNTEVNVSGVNFIGEKFKVTGGNKTAIDISFYVRRNSATAPLDTLQVVLMDADTNSIIEQGVLATAVSMNTTYSYKTYTFTTPRTLVLNKNYRIYLKSPTSNTTNNYIVSRLVTTNAANYNSITYDGTNSIYSLSSNSGTAWTDTNTNWDIGGYKFTVQISSGYLLSGTFESGSFDTTASSAFNNLLWGSVVPANTTLKFQIAVNNDNSTWSYFGPGGTGATYFALNDQIPLDKVNGRYIRYKAFFSGNGSVTPTLNDVTINYSP